MAVNKTILDMALYVILAVIVLDLAHYLEAKAVTSDHSGEYKDSELENVHLEGFSSSLQIEDGSATLLLHRIDSDVKTKTTTNPALSGSTNLPFPHNHIRLSFFHNGTKVHVAAKKRKRHFGSDIKVEEYDHSSSVKTKLSTDCFYFGAVLEWGNASSATVDVCNNFYTIVSYNGSDIYVKNATVIHHTSNHEDSINVHSQRSQHGTTPHDHVHARNKRALYGGRQKHYMEVMVVTDSSVRDFHGREVLEQYLITQMNIVDSVYHERSLGVEINVVVVKILIVDDMTARMFAVPGSGKRTLDRFCEWVEDYKPRDHSHSENFDIALYITRKDIGPAGYAPVTGMCNPKRSCAVNKDAGVSSAFVIAHEIGHVIGMTHDGYDNHCSGDSEDGMVMAATVMANFANVYWSTCSSHTILKYIDSLTCLNNKPRDSKSSQYTTYKEPYGVAWTMDEQCRQEFGNGYEVCKVFGHLDLCDTLWCSHSDEKMLCKTKRGPPLPGTACGPNKWCMDSKCVAKPRDHSYHMKVQTSVPRVYNKPDPQDGDWSTWSSWSECTRTCGLGIRQRDRSCVEPAPMYGGKECDGYDEEVQLCNTQKCEIEVDLRAEQCSEYDSTRYHDNRWHKWVPMDSEKASDECKLTCVSMGTGNKLISDGYVSDGTRCSYDKHNDVCVKGECHSVGCDGVLGSTKKEDKCGVCGGDGSTCKEVKNVLNQLLTKKEYNKVLVIPAQARDIYIREKSSSPYLTHFLAMAAEENPANMYLNANRRQSRGGQFVIEGTKFKYNARGPETLTANGPLLGNVELLVFSASHKLPSIIEYKYTIPKDLLNSVQTDIYAVKYKYTWKFKNWSQCSATCDGGSRIKEYECFEETKQRIVDIDLCYSVKKPEYSTEKCNEDIPCNPYKWKAGSWNTCSRTCGRKGIQMRSVTCMQTRSRGSERTWQVDPRLCSELEQPVAMKSCYTQPCVGIWHNNDWSQCSVTCGTGTQSRRVTCQVPRGYSREEFKCPPEEKPNDLRICDMKACQDPTTTMATTSTTKTTMAPETKKVLLSTTTMSTTPTVPSTTTSTTTMTTTSSTAIPTSTNIPTTSTTVTSLPSTTMPSSTETPEPTTLKLSTSTTKSTSTTTQTSTKVATTSMPTMMAISTTKSTTSTSKPTTHTTKPTTSTSKSTTSTTISNKSFPVSTKSNGIPTVRIIMSKTKPSTSHLLKTSTIQTTPSKKFPESRRNHMLRTAKSGESQSTKSVPFTPRPKTSTTVGPMAMSHIQDSSNEKKCKSVKMNDKTVRHIPLFPVEPLNGPVTTDSNSVETHSYSRPTTTRHRGHHHRRRYNKHRNNQNNQRYKKQRSENTGTARRHNRNRNNINTQQTPRSSRHNTYNNRRRFSIFSVFQKSDNYHSGSAKDLSTNGITVATTAKPARYSVRTTIKNCTRDRSSFFCQMDLTVAKCQTREYSTYCCHSCKIILGQS